MGDPVDGCEPVPCRDCGVPVPERFGWCEDCDGRRVRVVVEFVEDRLLPPMGVLVSRAEREWIDGLRAGV